MAKMGNALPSNESTLSKRQIPGFWEQVSTRVAFFIAGFGISAWAPLVPYAKARLGVDEATLGFLLLCLGAGSISIMPFAGLLAARFGCRLIIGLASLFLCITLPFLATAASIPAIVAALLVFGAAVGMIDVVVNIQAVIVEKAGGRPMMSGFHGLWSVGGFVGAGSVSGLLEAGVSPVAAMLCVAVIILALLVMFGRYLLPYGSEEKQGPVFVLPKGIVLFIGILCFIVFLAEGSMLDWSAVFLTSLRGVELAQAGLGYSLFSVTMTIGRLTGDRIVAKFGGRNVILFGGIGAAAGIAIAIFVPTWTAALLGFALLGLGSSNIVPVLYSVLGRQKVMPANLAVSAVSTLGYSGILAGPALIGFMAHSISLPFAFIVVAATMLAVAASAGIVAKNSTP